jgi:hypothetical protein
VAINSNRYLFHNMMFFTLFLFFTLLPFYKVNAAFTNIDDDDTWYLP